MVDLRRVLFEMDMIDADEFFGPVGADDLHPAADAQRIAVFGNLVILGHIGIEIILAIEGGVTVDFAAEHHAAHHRELYRLAVHHRQRAGIAEADRADVGVGLAAGLQQAAAEHLRVRLELDMGFKPDSVFEFHWFYLFVAQTVDRIEFRGTVRGIEPEEHAHKSGKEK